MVSIDKGNKILNTGNLTDRVSQQSSQGTRYNVSDASSYQAGRRLSTGNKSQAVLRKVKVIEWYFYPEFAP